MQSLTLTLDWSQLTEDTAAVEQLEQFILPGYMKSMRWFGGKARKLSAICVDKALRLEHHHHLFHLLIVRAKYRTGKSEDYLLPLALVSQTEGLSEKAVICNSDKGWVIDAIYEENFRSVLFIHLFHSSRVKQLNGYFQFEKGSAFKEEDYAENISSRVLEAEQSNSSLIFGEKYFLKIYRKLFRETNPDVEMVKFLTEKAHFNYIPGFAGTFFWKKAYGSPTTLGMMQQKVNAVKDAWSMAGDYLYEFIQSVTQENLAVPATSIEQASLLGKRTAEMHIALSGETVDAAFIPEAYNDEYADWILDNCLSLVKRRIRMAKDCYSALDETGKGLAKFFLNHEPDIRNFFAQIKSRTFQSKRTRIHGDYHLGQVMYDGSDYLILDFEGEPESSIKDRKIKHSPLKDVAGMLRSFHYAVSAKLYFSKETNALDAGKIETAVTNWYREVTKAYLDAYWQAMQGAPVFQAEQSELDFLLQFHLLEKAVYELGYELNARPTWVKIPLRGIQEVIKSLSPQPAAPPELVQQHVIQ
jgi:maltose alpha-D-glucosyltransferase/alpha-amylase